MNRVFWPWCLACWFFACGPHTTSQPQGYVDAQYDHFPPLWPNRYDIMVCWEIQDDSEFSDYRQVVRKIVVSEFRRAGLYLNGWRRCPEIFSGIRIFRTSGVDGVYGGFGSHVGGKKKAVRLNHFQGSLESFSGCKDRLAACASSLALHEIGHAVGLHHEMNRRDQDDDCPWEQADGMGEPNVTQIGDYDSESIMNYCKVLADMAEGRDSQLSLGDIRTLKLYYQGPWVQIEEPPAIHNSSHLTVRLSGFNAEHYRYKWGLSEQVDCRRRESYSQKVSIENPVFMDFKESLDGHYTLCILGGKGRKWQDEISYSSTNWTLDRLPPVAMIKNTPDGYSHLDRLYLRLEPSVDRYRWKFGSKKIRCNEQEGYSNSVTLIVESFGIVLPRDIVIDQFAVPLGPVKLCVIGGDRAGNWQSLSSASVFTWTRSH